MTRRLIHILIVLQVLLAGACGKDVVAPDDTKDPDPGGGNDPGKEATAVINVATCNVLKPSGRREEMSLDNLTVREALARSIMDTGADLISFNELDETFLPGGPYSLPSSCATMKGFQWKLEWPNDIKSTGSVAYSYANGFAYNGNVLRLEECSYVWLDKTEDRWYTSSTSAYSKVGSPERTCIRARFTHLASGKDFWFFVTHLPTKSQGGAANMAAVVNHLAKSTTSEKPAILAGDMNSALGSVAYRNLLSYWSDSNIEATWGTLSGSSANYYYTVDVFTTNHPDRRIDHIMTRGCTASDYHTIVSTYTLNGKEWCPSDHLPLVATVTL